MTPETNDGYEGDDVTSTDPDTGATGDTATASGDRVTKEAREREDMGAEEDEDTGAGEGEDTGAGEGEDLSVGEGGDRGAGDGAMGIERTAAFDADGQVRALHGRIRLKWSGQVVIATAILAAVGVGLSLALDPVATWMVAAVAVPLLALGLLWVPLRYRLWAFQFRSDHLFLERGVYRNVETAVPYVRIQHVDTSRGPVERVLGLSTLVVYTAGSRGADVAIPGLPHDEAEDMQDRVKDLAIAAEGGEGL